MFGKKISYKSPLSKKEFIENLKNLTADRSAGSSPDKKFVGKIDGSTFKIVRISGFLNSFNPKIVGNVESSDSGSKVEFKTSLNTRIFECLSVLLSVLFFVLLAIKTMTMDANFVDLLMTELKSFLILVVLLVPLLFVFLKTVGKKAYERELEKSLSYLKGVPFKCGE